MTNICNQSGQEVLATTDQHPRVTKMPKKKLMAHDNRLFGKDGFTFFDFLDIINPLQHIPVISTIYRSITGDQIDSGSRIAGATLFGGPLGGALASMDIAIKNKTGLDIVEHTATFFTEGGVSNPNTENLVVISVTAPNRNATIEANPAPITFLPIQTRELDARETPHNKFHSAGMTAIPLAKNNLLSSKQTQRELQTRLPMVTNKLPNKTRNSNLTTPKIRQPLSLTPRFSARTVKNPGDPLNISHIKVNEDFSAPEQTETLTKENWVIGAMLKGLGKYTSAKKLTKSTYRPTYSVNH